MFNNITKKVVSGAIALSMTLSGLAFMPMLASANNDLHVGVNAKANTDAKHENAKFNFGGKGFFGLGNVGVDLKTTTSESSQTTFKQAVKDANTNFKTAKQNAKTQLKASVSATTSQADHKAAVKAYFTNVLAALKVRSAAIETAFQAFISTNF